MNVTLSPIFSDPLLVVTSQVTLILAVALLLGRIFFKSAAIKKCILLAGLLFSLTAPIVFFCCNNRGVEFPILTISASQNADVFAIDCGNTPAIQDAPKDLAELPVVLAHAEISSSTQSSPNTNAVQPESHRAQNSRETNRNLVRSAILLIWFSLSAACFAGILISMIRLKTILQNSNPIHDGFAPSIKEANIRFCLKHLPKVIVSDVIASPAAIGWGRFSWIIIPQNILDSVSSKQLVQVLVHETAHIAKLDTITQVLGRVAIATWWWHPLVHLLVRDLGQSQEEVCDNMVLSNTEATDYGTTLLELGKAVGSQPRPFATVFLFGSRWPLEERIKGILAPNRKMDASARLATWLIVLFVFTALTVGASAAKIARQVQQESAPVETEQQKQQEVYQAKIERQRKQSTAPVLYILDGYLGLSIKQQELAKKLSSEKLKHPITGGISYNFYPRQVMRAIGTSEFRQSLTGRQLEVYDALEEDAFDLMTQINSLGTHTRDEWAGQPASMLEACVQLRIEQTDSILDMNEEQRGALRVAGNNAIQEIVEARKILHQRYSKDPHNSADNVYVMRLMMDGPINQIGNTEAWQTAMNANFSGMELAMLDELSNAKKQLCINDSIYQWKYDGSLRRSISDEQDTLLEPLLQSVANRYFANQASTSYQISSLDLSRNLDLRSNDELKKILTEKQWDIYSKSFVHRDSTKHVHISVKRETLAQFAASQKPKPAPKLSETVFTFKDPDGKPASNLQIEYVGFHIIRKDGSKPFQFSSFYNLKPVRTDRNGRCVINHPTERNVTRIAVRIKDERFLTGKVDLHLNKEGSEIVTLNKRVVAAERDDFRP